jgi:hypothetical protein
MRTCFSPALQIVGLDWRLLVSACRAHGTDLMLPTMIGAFVLAAFRESAMATASVIAGRPAGIVYSVLAVFVWNACLAAAVLVIAIGGHSTAQRIVRYLAPEPITRGQIYTALVLLSVAGRHVLVSGIVLIPIVSLLTGLVEPARTAGASLALLVVMRLVPGVTRCMAALAGALTGPGIALASMTVAALVLLIRPTVDGVIATLPPSLVVQYVVGTRTPQSLWLLLALWTAVIGVVEYATLMRPATSQEVPPAVAALPVIPGWMRGAARVTGVAAPLLHGELLRLIRWRRFLLGWFVYGAVLAIALERMPSLDTRVLPILLVALAPSFVATATLGNLFAPDRAGVQAFYLALDEAHSAVRAKIVAIGVFVLIAEVITLGLLSAFVSKQWHAGDLYSPLMAAAFFVWIGSAGRITSTLFPAATDPRAVGGSLLRGPGALLFLLLNGLGLVGIVAPALSHDTRGIGVSGLLLAGLAIASFVAVAARFSARVSERALSARREELIANLAQESSLS